MSADEWKIIKKALEDPNYKWRTINGIAQSTGLDTKTIVNSITNNEEHIVKSSIPSLDGFSLFTTRQHYRQKTSPFQIIANSIKNQVE